MFCSLRAEISSCSSCSLQLNNPTLLIRSCVLNITTTLLLVISRVFWSFYHVGVTAWQWWLDHVWRVKCSALCVLRSLPARPALSSSIIPPFLSGRVYWQAQLLSLSHCQQTMALVYLQPLQSRFGTGNAGSSVAGCTASSRWHQRSIIQSICTLVCWIHSWWGQISWDCASFDRDSFIPLCVCILMSVCVLILCINEDKSVRLNECCGFYTSTT